MQFTVHDDSEALQRAIRVSQAVSRVRQMPTVFVSNPLLTAFVALAFWDRASHELLVVLVALMVLLLTPPMLSWRRLRHRARPADVSTRNEWRAVISSLVLGLVWGGMVWHLYPLGTVEERATLVILMAGLTGGSVAFFSSSPVASIGYFLSFMVPLLVQAARFDSAEDPIIPSTIAVFILSALLFTRTSWHQFVESVRVVVERDQALADAKVATQKLEQALKRMEGLAMVDELTGLKNRRAFFDDAEPAIAAARRRDQPIAVALLDLDHFKDVNDTHGHAAGDVVLRAVAKRITGTLREEQIVGRFGGEEFVALLPDTTPAQALIAMERVRKVVGSEPIRVPDGREVTVTLSGGIAALGENEGIEAAIDHADKAMYRAKGLGRDRVEVFGVFEG